MFLIKNIMLRTGGRMNEMFNHSQSKVKVTLMVQGNVSGNRPVQIQILSTTLVYINRTLSVTEFSS